MAQPNPVANPTQPDASTEDKKEDKSEENKEGQNVANEEEEDSQKVEIISKEMKDNIEYVFNIYDKTKEGFCKFEDLPMILRALNFNPTTTDLNAYNSAFDIAKKGTFDLKALTKIVEIKLKDTDTYEELYEALKLFDEDKDGKLSVQEFRYAMTQMGDQMKEEEVDDMIKEADSGQTGYVEIKEYTKFLLNIKS